MNDETGGPVRATRRRTLRAIAAVGALVVTAVGAPADDIGRTVAEDGGGDDPARPAASSKLRSPEDGWLDLGGFRDQSYGFVPLVMPITEPAVGYGGAGALAFIDKPKGEGQAGFGRPNITGIGGMGTENGSWGVLAGDVRHWLDDRLQTLVGAAYASVNLDFHGIGEDQELLDDPLTYNLKPLGGTVQAKYRLGHSRFWAGLSYALANTRVEFDAPSSTPNLPDYQSDSRVGGLTPSLTYDSRAVRQRLDAAMNGRHM